MHQLKKLLNRAKLAMGPVILSLLALALGLSLTTLASAQVRTNNIALGVMPTIQTVTLKEGQSSTYEVTVSNDGKTALEVEMHAIPYSMTADYSSNVFDAPSTRTQITDWVFFQEEDRSFILEANEQRQIVFTVNVPVNAPEGSQYAAVAARGKIASASAEGVMAHYQIASLFMAEIEGSVQRGGEVVNRQFGGWYKEPTITTSLAIRNTGNTHFFVNNSLTVKNVFGGKEIAHIGENAPKVVFNDYDREFELEWEAPGSIGFYYLTQNSDFLGQLHSEQRLAVVLPVWVIVIAAAVVLVLLLLLILLIRKIVRAKTRRRTSPPRSGAIKRKISK